MHKQAGRGLADDHRPVRIGQSQVGMQRLARMLNIPLTTPCPPRAAQRLAPTGQVRPLPCGQDQVDGVAGPNLVQGGNCESGGKLVSDRHGLRVNLGGTRRLETGTHA